ncbi:hypothetical protein GJ496_004685 [Pomphorhynchus laevis]|nr:hypothetical protein GJ496_004685 [Pomphorhynchus laevis]
MVRIHLKIRDQSQFLHDAATQTSILQLQKDICDLYNARIKIFKICSEFLRLKDYGLQMPTDMRGLAPSQLKDLNLTNEWARDYEPSGGYNYNADPLLERNGEAPNEKMQNLIERTVNDIKCRIDKKLIEHKLCLTSKTISSCFDEFRGLSMIIYPMSMPDFEIIWNEINNINSFENWKDSVNALPLNETCLWFGGKELQQSKKLSDYIGTNEKSTIIVKLQKVQNGPPPREPPLCDQQRIEMMNYFHKRNEEQKRLQEDEDDSYLDSEWADSKAFKKSIHKLENDQLWRSL